jgi:hypothetical protein
MNVMPGNDDDSLISGDNVRDIVGNNAHQILLEQISRDPGSFKVMRNCDCGMDYMTRAYIGDDMHIYYACICGRIEEPKK